MTAKLRSFKMGKTEWDCSLGAVPYFSSEEKARKKTSKSIIIDAAIMLCG